MAGADPTDYCADLSVALHYYNAEDKWKDDHNLLGAWLCLAGTPAAAGCPARWPRQCNAIRTCLDKAGRV